jgi:hypothetical protein
LIAHRLLQNNERLEMELAHYRRALVVYRPRWQRALPATWSTQLRGNETCSIRIARPLPELRHAMAATAQYSGRHRAAKNVLITSPADDERQDRPVGFRR